jgi:hypothetical protein
MWIWSRVYIKIGIREIEGDLKAEEIKAPVGAEFLQEGCVPVPEVDSLPLRSFSIRLTFSNSRQLHTVPPKTTLHARSISQISLHIIEFLSLIIQRRDMVV